MIYNYGIFIYVFKTNYGDSKYIKSKNRDMSIKWHKVEQLIHGH